MCATHREHQDLFDKARAEQDELRRTVSELRSQLRAAMQEPRAEGAAPPPRPPSPAAAARLPLQYEAQEAAAALAAARGAAEDLRVELAKASWLPPLAWHAPKPASPSPSASAPTQTKGPPSIEAHSTR